MSVHPLGIGAAEPLGEDASSGQPAVFAVIGDPEVGLPLACGRVSDPTVGTGYRLNRGVGRRCIAEHVIAARVSQVSRYMPPGRVAGHKNTWVSVVHSPADECREHLPLHLPEVLAHRAGRQPDRRRDVRMGGVARDLVVAELDGGLEDFLLSVGERGE